VKVYVYWNLHKGIWSIKALEGPDKGKVISRREKVILSDVEGKVSEAGRQRVLRERKKNVHAGMVGTLIEDKFDTHSTAIRYIGDRVTYNPYKYTSFVHTVDESPFEGSAWAYLNAWGRVYVA
jgi:hypothetical protein